MIGGRFASAKKDLNGRNGAVKGLAAFGECGQQADLSLIAIRGENGPNRSLVGRDQLRTLYPISVVAVVTGAAPKRTSTQPETLARWCYARAVYLS